MNESSAQVKTQKAGLFGLRLIAFFKLVKGLLLLCVGLGALALVGHDVAAVAGRLVNDLHMDRDNRYIHALLLKLGVVNRQLLHEISLGTFVYSALLLTEGFGLMWDKRWAEHLTIIVTSAFLPLELYELIHHATWAKAALLVFNAVVVWYLWTVLQQKRAKKS